MKKQVLGTSLVVQWLRLGAPKAEGPDSIPGQGCHMPHATAKTLHASNKDLACHN